MDSFSQGTETLQYLSGKVRACEEEISGLKRDTDIILSTSSESWQGETADAFRNKMDEIVISLKKVTDNLEETLRLISAMNVLVAEDEEKARKEAETQETSGSDSEGN